LGDSKVSQLEFLNKINDVKIEYIDCGINSLTEENLNEFYKLWGEEYQIDGLVIEFNDSKIREQLGREENMNPAYAVAYKNPQWSDEASVKVTGVEFQVSKQGKLKPVINIEPTYVGGVTISNVTGYNAKYIFDNNIAEGSIIKIVRSGDVIPKHIETILFVQSNVEKLADELVLCPSCKEHTVWDDTFTEIICTNPECDSIKISKLVHFFNTLEVEDFGEPSIKQLYYEGYDTIPSILGFSMTQLTNIEGWAMKSADRLLNQFRKLAVVGVPVARLLHALDVFDGKIGEKTCQKILDDMDLSLLDNIYLSQNLSNIENDLTMIDGVSSITARVFIKGLKNFHDNFIELINISITQWKTPKQRSIGNKMSGHSVCFTGFRDKSLEQGIESQGGKIASGVSKNTTILVVKDLCSGSSKMKKASELGIQVYDVNGFKRTFNI
jgi:DNA ligase (NAD+)